MIVSIIDMLRCESTTACRSQDAKERENLEQQTISSCSHGDALVAEEKKGPDEEATTLLLVEIKCTCEKVSKSQPEQEETLPVLPLRYLFIRGVSLYSWRLSYSLDFFLLSMKDCMER